MAPVDTRDQSRYRDAKSCLQSRPGNKEKGRKEVRPPNLTNLLGLTYQYVRLYNYMSRQKGS